MFQFFIAQNDETCNDCGCELPRGSHCLVSDEELICEDCAERRDSENGDN